MEKLLILILGILLIGSVLALTTEQILRVNILPVDDDSSLVKIPIQSCIGEGELYLYQEDPFQEIETSFVVSRDQVLVFARSDASISAKVNNVDTPLFVVKEETEDFHVKIYSLETSPGSIVNIDGTSPEGARRIQGYLAQDAANPVFNLDTLEVIIDDERINSLNLTPDVYSYVFFDKYSENRPGRGVDNRLLRVMVDGVSGNVIDESFTQPHPSPIEGAVVGNFSIEESGMYNLSVETEDSIYWVVDGCVQLPQCGDGIVQTGEECDDDNDNNLDECRNDCTLPFCGDGIVDSGEQCDDGTNNITNGSNDSCTLISCGDGIIEEPNDLGENNSNQTNSSADGSDSNFEIFVASPSSGGSGSGGGGGSSNSLSGTSQINSNETNQTQTNQGDDGSLVGIGDDGDQQCQIEHLCGDGNLDTNEGEQCDDGNNISGDGCNAECQLEICSDNIL